MKAEIKCSSSNVIGSSQSKLTNHVLTAKIIHLESENLGSVHLARAKTEKKIIFTKIYYEAYHKFHATMIQAI